MGASDLLPQFSQAAELIAASRRPLLICHVAPDGDAIGSLLGLQWLLDARGKDVTALSQDGVPENLRFLPGSATVVTEAGGSVVTEAGGSADLLIAVDCSDPGRLGKVAEDARFSRLPLINIDHHITNPGFGAVNIVDPLAASTAELLFELAQALDWDVSTAAAQCLLTGVVTDTQGFRTSNTTARSLYCAQRLMEAGGSLHQVTERTLERRSYDTICLWGQALAAAQLEDGIAWTAIPLTMRTPCGGVEQKDSGIASFLVSAEEAEVSVVIVERKDGAIDVGFRSAGRVDVAGLAMRFGGGGHPKAAGCTLHESLPDAVEIVLAATRAAIDEAGQ